MVNPSGCVVHHPDLPATIAVELGFTVFHAGLLIILYSERCCCHPRRRKHASPRYGLAPKLLLYFLCWMGLLVSVTPVLLYYTFHLTRHAHGWPPTLICQSAYAGTVVPVLAGFFTAFAALLVSSVCFRRRTAATAVTSVPLQGSEDVVVFPARRGLVAAALAKRLDGAGHVTCLDQWSAHSHSETEAWCLENLLREGVPPQRTSCMSVDDFDVLPFRSDTIDVVALPFVTTMPAMSSGATSVPAMANPELLKMCMEECFRILRPGGFLWGLETFWRVEQVAELARQVGFQHVHVVNAGCFFVAALPQKAFIARKSVLSDWVPGEDEEAHAAATVASLSTSGYPVPVKPTLKDVLVPAPLQAAYSSPPRRPQASVRTPRSPRSSTRLLARKLRVDRTWVFASRDSLLQLFGQMVMVGLWLVAMWLLQAYWDDLAVPTNVPWTNQVRAQLIRAALVYPMCLYFCYVELRHYIVRRQRTTCDVVCFMCTRVMSFTLVALLAFCAITWLPALAVDLVVHAVFHDPNYNEGSLNVVLQVLFAVVLIRVAVWWASYRASVAPAQPVSARPVSYRLPSVVKPLRF